MARRLASSLYSLMTFAASNFHLSVLINHFLVVGQQPVEGYCDQAPMKFH